MPKTLTFLHTSPAHVKTFNLMLKELAPDIPAQHIVNEGFLQEARASGTITPTLNQRITQTIFEAINRDAGVVLCTCSTIGACAEMVSKLTKTPVLRIDKPMAQKAISLGSRLIVAATLSSTLQPTRDLILATAQEMGKTVTIQEIICESAWEKFDQGELEASYQEIADTLRRNTSAGDVIVLAQASMAGAVAYCADLPIPVLSSPRLGLEAAIEAYRTA